MTAPAGAALVTDKGYSSENLNRFPVSRVMLGSVKQPLMGFKEIADLLGVSRQRARQLAATPAFPEPVARLAAGPIYESAAVEAWAKTRNTKSGRPRKDSP